MELNFSIEARWYIDECIQQFHLSSINFACIMLAAS